MLQVSEEIKTAVKKIRSYHISCFCCSGYLTLLKWSFTQLTVRVTESLQLFCFVFHFILWVGSEETVQSQTAPLLSLRLSTEVSVWIIVPLKDPNKRHHLESPDTSKRFMM